jgi:hypothetical protein
MVLVWSATHELMVAAESIPLGIEAVTGTSTTIAHPETPAVFETSQSELLRGPEYDSTTNALVQQPCAPSIDQADIFYRLATNGNLPQLHDIEAAICHSQ